MNASTFFTEDMFNRLKKDILAKKVIPHTETPYRKEIKIKGNKYKLTITTGHYVVGDKDYYTSLWHDEQYTDKNGHRNMSGGTGSSIILDSYQAFLDGINKLLRRFPDFTEEEFYEEQLSWF